ncbi:MAG: hypothetical protein HEQ39_12450 [Rhizobacter sp.]
MNVSTFLVRLGIAVALAGLFFLAPFFNGHTVGTVVVGSLASGVALAGLGWLLGVCSLVWGER